MLFSWTMKSKHLTTLLLVLVSSCTIAQTFEQRRDQYIDSVTASNYDDAIIIQAFLNQPVNQNRLDSIYLEFPTKPTIDFQLVSLIRVMFLGNGLYDAQMIPHLETLPFWVNDQDSLHTYWTENHMIMWMSSHWLLHERHNWTVDNGLHKRLLHYLNLKLEYGFHEFFSSTYLPYTLSGLLNLADFAEDQEIKSKSEQVAKKLLRHMQLMVNAEGAYYPSAGRNYIGKYIEPYNQTHNSIIFLGLGIGPCPSEGSSRGNFLATTTIDLSDIQQTWSSQLDTILEFGYSPEDAILRHDSLYETDQLMQLWSGGMYFHPLNVVRSATLLNDSSGWDHVDFQAFAPLAYLPSENYLGIAEEFDEMSISSTTCGPTIALFKNEATTLASLQDYWKGKVGYQQWPVVANVGGHAVFPASGEALQDWEDRRETNFNEHLPYVAQESNVALVMYRPQEVSQFLPYGEHQEVALFWQDSVFDEISESNNWLFGRRAENYVAVRRACTSEINGVRACEMNVGQTWVLIVGNDNMYGSYQSFTSMVEQSVFDENWIPDALTGDSAYYASITFDGNTIDYTWSPPAPTGILTHEKVESVLIYPNPSVNGLFTVDIPLEKHGDKLQLYVYDVVGNLVQNNATDNGQITIDLSHADAGTFIMVLDNGMQRWVERLTVLP